MDDIFQIILQAVADNLGIDHNSTGTGSDTTTAQSDGNDEVDNQLEEQNETVYDIGFCNTSKKIDSIQFYRFVLVPAAVIVIALSFFLKRRRIQLGCLSGRPGFVFPVNLVDRQPHRFSYVAAFTFASWAMLDLILGPKSQPPDDESTERKHKTGLPFYDDEMFPFSKALFLLLACLNFAFMYYPIFAALSSHHVFGYAAGAVYTWLHLAHFVLEDNFCPKGIPAAIALNFINIAPPFLCLVYLSAAFPIWFCKTLCFRKTKTHPDSCVLSMPEATYVRNALKGVKPMTQKPVELKWYQKLAKKIYEPTPAFKYSVSILSGVSAAFCFVFMISTGLLSSFYIYYSKYYLTGLRLAYNAALRNELVVHHPIAQRILNTFGVNVKLIEEAIFIGDMFEAILYISLTLPFVNVAVCLLLTLKYYKSNMLLIYQGKQYDIPKSEDYSPKALLLSGARFIGYQSAYATWGFIFQWILIFLGLTVFCTVMLLDFRYRITGIVLWIIRRIWLGLALMLLLLITQHIMAVCFFLMKNDKGDRVLAVDNRRFFFNFHYFAVFANTALGFVSCLLRILKSIIFGLWMIPRLDMSTLNRHFERFDPGFVSYIGLLYLENAHRNPIMLVAAGFLTETVRQKQSLALVRVGHKLIERPMSPRFKLVRNRWNVLLTLQNNPSLRVYRKEPPPPLGLFHVSKKALYGSGELRSIA